MLQEVLPACPARPTSTTILVMGRVSPGGRPISGAMANAPGLNKLTPRPSSALRHRPDVAASSPRGAQMQAKSGATSRQCGPRRHSGSGRSVASWALGAPHGAVGQARLALAVAQTPWPEEAQGREGGRRDAPPWIKLVVPVCSGRIGCPAATVHRLAQNSLNTKVIRHGVRGARCRLLLVQAGALQVIQRNLVDEFHPRV